MRHVYLLDVLDIETVCRTFCPCILLDSSQHGPYGRYTFIGILPKSVRNAHDVSTISKEKEDPSVALLLKDLPFTGGLMGFWGYEGSAFFEDRKKHCKPTELPPIWFADIDTLFVIDHLANTHYLIATPEKATHVFERLIQPQKAGNFHFGTLTDSLPKEKYIAAIQYIQQAIKEGQLYQANLSHRFSAPFTGDPLSAFFALRKRCPSPFSALIHTEEFTIASVSPERFFNIQNGTIASRPIKGTAPRGHDTPSDAKHMSELKNSEKDQAELMMIVDLIRNDLGRICEIGSIQVPELKTLETFADVHHLVATIHGKLKPNISLIDLFDALSPGGSITGTPKLSAMSLINTLEPTPREIYTGAIGYWTHKNADFNIAIRTMYFHNGYAYYHAGGGITADSIPEQEWEETLAKSKSFLGLVTG